MFDIPMDLRSLEKEIIAYEQDIRMKDGSPAVVNHGFGTSTTEERLYYYDRMVRPWAPRALVLATWGNDSMYGYSPEQSMHATAQLLAWARADFPGIKLFLVEPHPNPKAKEPDLPDKWNNRLRERNSIREMLKVYADTHEDTTLITLWDQPELFEEGHVGDHNYIREELFVQDKVHPNQAGYDVLGPIFRKALDEVL